MVQIDHWQGIKNGGTEAKNKRERRGDKENNRGKTMKVHFIGAGGIGVSALARYYLEKGYEVSGSDLSESEITETLKQLGAKIFIGKHISKNLTKNVDLVIYSPAVQSNNIELKEASKIQNTKYKY